MKESDAKLLWCPRTERLWTHDDEQNIILHEDCCCMTRQCAAWEPEYENQSKYLPLNDPSPGPDWHEGTKFKNGTEETKRQWIRWVRTDSGDCGLKSKEQGCFYPG